VAFLMLPSAPVPPFLCDHQLSLCAGVTRASLESLLTLRHLRQLRLARRLLPLFAGFGPRDVAAFAARAPALVLLAVPAALAGDVVVEAATQRGIEVLEAL